MHGRVSVAVDGTGSIFVRRCGEIQAEFISSKEQCMVKRAFGLVIVLCLSIPAYSQTLGTITGEVKDSSGATIPGATVTAQNVATNALRSQTSNEVGAFTFPAMPPGRYLIKAELQGFKTAQNTVELHVEEAVRVNFALEIGTFSEATERRPVPTEQQLLRLRVGPVDLRRAAPARHICAL